MYTTYYDTSGSDRQPMVTTVGLFASVSRWERFEKQWKSALEQARMPYLHMKEFVNCIPPYEHFKEDEPARIRFIQTAIDIIADGDMRVIAMTVAPDDFRTVNSTYKLAEVFGGPWGLCAYMCAVSAEDWRHIEESALIAHYHERGERGMGRLVDLLAKADIKIEFRKKVDPHTGEWFVPFQACDFVAWEIRRGILKLREGDHRGRQSIGNLYDRLETLNPMLKTWLTAGPESLVAMCQRYARLIEKR